MGAAPYPALLAGARVSTRKIYGFSRAIQEQLGVMSTSIQEDLAGVSVVKLYGLEELRHRRFRALNDAYLARALSLVRSRGVLGPQARAVAGGSWNGSRNDSTNGPIGGADELGCLHAESIRDSAGIVANLRD